MNYHSIENDPEYIQLQTELIWLQQELVAKNQKTAILFEGRDTAGKGGAIMRFIRFMNPRRYRVVALGVPTPIEKGQWYFQRYIKELPGPGEIVFFDRSWYNRAVVEPVMGFCAEQDYLLFMQQVVQLEKMLIDSGLKLFKFWFSIDAAEQARRLEGRAASPLKSWKLSTVDAKAQLKWDEFTRYKEQMFQQTGTEQSPWIVVNGNDRERARNEAMRYVLHHSTYERKGETGVSFVVDKGTISSKGAGQ